ncbi:MAG: 6-hydroxynicotinate reductase, partial [Thermodesulfobacteriota bacterium]|nr:6-hydroxynicotinate reductase [Thermodesulfobacteriota bacterium]
MKISPDKCKGCGHCVSVCPQNAIAVVKKKASITDACCECRACMRVCPEQAFLPDESWAEGAVACEACPVRCRIKEDFVGACQRFVNRSGKLERTVPLLSFEDVKRIVGPDWQPYIRQPIITGVGAGTTYPDCKPAPNIVQRTVSGVDVVTVVTEAPLSYSGIKLKIDTDLCLG